MDFDLFELDEDDDILSSICLEPTQFSSTQLVNDVLPEFHCGGEDKMKSQFAADGFVRSGFITSVTKETQPKNIAIDALSLTPFDFQAEQLHGNAVSQYMFGEACMNIQYLVASSMGNIGTYDEQSNYKRRRSVTMLLQLLLHKESTCQWHALQKGVLNMRNLINRVTEGDIWKLIYCANSCKGNNCNLPSFHLLHGALEWKLLDLYLLHRLNKNDDTDRNPGDSKPLITQLLRIFEDLLSSSLYHFAKKRSVELLFSSAFPCTCFKEMWLMLQLTLQQWNLEPEFCFWRLLDKTIEKVNTKLEYFALNQLQFSEFINWMIVAFSRLHGYRSNGVYEGPSYIRACSQEAQNYALLERNTQQFLQANPNEEQLRTLICLLIPTLLQWWQPKVNIVQLLWEYFHKRLNSSFYVAGATPAQLAVVCTTGSNYLQKYRQLLTKTESLDANLNSYTLFTLLLGKTLERLLHAQLPNQAQKLLGRIYSKFSLQKFLALNEMGIHHLIELFLVLALCGDFSELAPKLRDKLLSIALDKIVPAKQVAVVKGHMALLILCSQQAYDCTEYISKLLQQLLAVRHDIAVCKIIADALLDIFEHAVDFQRGEELLLDTWLPSFLASCTPVEQERSLQALHLIFVKLQQGTVLHEQPPPHGAVIKALMTHILPFVKQQYMSSFSVWIPQLAADFCIHCSINSEPQSANSFAKLFKHFVEATTLNRQALPTFLLHVLNSEKRTAIDAAVIMHVWLRSLVLLTAVNEDVVNLTNIVVQLPEFQWLTQLAPPELLQAKEPLCVFVAAVGKNYINCTDQRERCRYADSLNDYLRNFEKWLQLDLKHEKSELAFRFYSFIAIVIYNCAPIIYSKSKISCFFHVAITRFVLPTSIQMGKAPEARLSQLIHKIWPVLVQGIGRLNFKSDAYVTKTLTDLIQKWTPHFKISPNSKVVARPFIICLQGDNNELSLFIFEKLTSLFLTTQRRQADPNACLVITIFQEVVEAVASSTVETNNASRLETFVKGTSLMMLEHIMMVDEMVPSRTLLLELFKRIVTSPVFQSSSALKGLLAEHLRIITKRHLAYYTFFYFELIMRISKISYALVEEIMDFLLDEVRVVEQKRGAGEDNRIRGCLQKLQQSIASSKQNDSAKIHR